MSKKKGIKIDGRTGAGEHQVGRVNRNLSKKKNGDRSDLRHSVDNDYMASLNVLQRMSKDLKDSSGKAEQFKSDIAFERKRKAKLAKAKKAGKKTVKKMIKKKDGITYE